MTRKMVLMAAIASAVAFTAPAQAGGWKDGWKGGHTHYCGCGHKTCGSTTSSSGGGTTSSSGGTKVPEPGMLAMLGLGLIGVGYARNRRNRAK